MRHVPLVAVAVLCCSLASSPCVADGAATSHVPVSTAFRYAVAEAPAPAAPSGGRARFGAADSWRWQVQGGGGMGGSDEAQGLLGGGVSWFFVENLSLDLELNGVYYSQPGDDAWAVNPALLFRWHFLARDTWSLYFDGGAGIQWATEDVPPGGSGFGFTPQVGFGASVEIAADTRLLAGVRWRHVSNANLDEDNDPLDAVFAYAQLSFPF